VLLDRDWRVDSEVHDVRAALDKVGVEAHVWTRHELESYLLSDGAISRVTKTDPSWVNTQLEEISAGFRAEAEAQISVAVKRAQPQLDQVASVRRAQELVKDWWSDPTERLLRLPAKEIITGLNTRLQAAHHRAVSARALAKAMRLTEIPAEMTDIIHRLNGLADGR